MVASFFTAFDPQLKITVREGKVFDGQNEKIRAVCALPEVSVSTETLEENAMVQYKDRQAMVVLKETAFFTEPVNLFFMIRL